MTYYSWPTGVNSDFFSFTKTPVDSTEETTFTGGRRIVRAVNTRAMHEYSFSVALSMQASNNEYKKFYDWYDSIGGKAGIWTCSAIGTGYYRFTDVPSEDSTSMQSRTVNLSVEEVY